MEIKINQIPSMNTNNVINTLTLMYSNTINNNIDLDTLPAVMLWGQPGVGKSDSVAEIAKRIEKNTNKKVNVTDIRLILFNPVDLRGIPTFNNEKTLAVWLKPKILDLDESKDVINILFLDELTSCTPSVQAAAYQITLDKKVGEHKLPNNTIVIAAGNRTVDKSVSYNMPKALANRLLHIEVVSNFASWKKWAINSNIHPNVIRFLTHRADMLNTFNPQSDELAFATPRTWEMVSNILNNVSDNFTQVYDLISGLVGKGAASEFRNYCENDMKMPNIENIFNGTETYVPKEGDVIYATIKAMSRYATDHKDRIDLIDNSIQYANNLPPDYQVVLIKDYIAIEKDFKNKLLSSYNFKTWISKRGRLIDETSF